MCTIGIKSVVYPVKFRTEASAKKNITLYVNHAKKHLGQQAIELKNVLNALQSQFAKLAPRNLKKLIISTGITARKNVATLLKENFILAVIIMQSLQEIIILAVNAVQKKNLMSTTLTYLEGLEKPIKKGVITI
jgi:hypothetical protein